MVGQFVPNYGQTRAYLAHWAMTNRYHERVARVRTFFLPDVADDWRAGVMKAEGVTLVLSAGNIAGVPELYDFGASPRWVPVFSRPKPGSSGCGRRTRGRGCRAGSGRRSGSMSATQELRFYLHSKSTSLWHYVASETLQALLGWIPGVVGIGLRAVAYKLVLKAQGFPAIEDHVRFVRTEDIRLGRSVYIDHGVYLHGGQGGLEIGDGSWVMAGCRLHVFNFRGIAHAGIRIGRRTFLGEETLMRGQGGITVGDNVLFAPRVQVLAVDHVMTDPSKPIMDQGITAAGSPSRTAAGSAPGRSCWTASPSARARAWAPAPS